MHFWVIVAYQECVAPEYLYCDCAVFGYGVVFGSLVGVVEADADTVVKWLAACGVVVCG